MINIFKAEQSLKKNLTTTAINDQLLRACKQKNIHQKLS